ncbi:MAG: hypothetical protein CL674_14660 [Bdellovibrionaceae bacterium]|nr:hypothetical protein [Pseudobdellovibrionaceae bacterium]
MTGNVSEKNTFVSGGRLIRRPKPRSNTKKSKIKRTQSRRPKTCLRKTLLFQKAGSFEDLNRGVIQKIKNEKKPKPK